MKIINPSSSDRKATDRNHFLDIEIQRLQIEVGITDGPEGKSIPRFMKERFYRFLEAFVDAKGAVKLAQEETNNDAKAKSTSFALFSSLPTELAMGSQALPRVHCISVHQSKQPLTPYMDNSDEEDDCASRDSKFISNQPISPLLHVCRESRAYYLSHTERTTFAFETFVDFGIDIIYLPELKKFTQEIFGRFLKCDCACEIQTLALRKDFLCQIPLEGHFSGVHMEMRDYLPEWKETIAVFEDGRRTEEVWEDLDMCFRDLSAREKRKRAERGYVRIHMKVLNRMVKSWDYEPMVYRFVVPRDEQEHTEAFD